jgi:hypothetical protein
MLALTAYHFRLIPGWQAPECRYEARLGLVGDDGTRRDDLSAQAVPLLTKHFAKKEAVTAAFAVDKGGIAVHGGIPRQVPARHSELAQKLGGVSPAIPAPAPEQRLRDGFADLRSGALGLFLVIDDPQIRASAYEELKGRLGGDAPPLLNRADALIAVDGLTSAALQKLLAKPELEAGQRLLRAPLVTDGHIMAGLVLVERQPFLTGDALADLRVQPRQDSPDRQSFEVSTSFDDAGAQVLERVTAAHVGSYLAVALGSEALMIPKIMSPIKGGKAAITTGIVLDDAGGEIRAGRLVTSIELGRQLKVPLRFALEDVKVDCD